MKWFMWAFMLVCNLLCPIAMIVIGRKFAENPPKERNGWYGYRTNRSMKSQDTWDFAHQVCGRIWRKTGWAMLPLAVLGQLLTLLAPTFESMCMWSIAPVTVEIIVMLAAIVPVERALKQNFDENGMRR